MRCKRSRPRRMLAAVLICLIAAATATAAAEELLSLNYKNADLRDVLNSLAAQAGVSLTMDETVTGVVSFHFENVTFDDCLNRLAAMFRLQIAREGKFYTVTRQLIKVTKETGDLLTVEFQTARLAAVLAELARVTGVNATISGQPPADYVNLSLRRVSLEDLLGFLAESTRCQVERRNGVYVFRSSGAAGAVSLKYENGRLSADLSGVPMSVLARELTNKTGVTVLCDQSAAAAQVTIYFASLPLDEALNAMAAAGGLRVYKEGEHYRFMRGESPGMIRVQDGRLTMEVRNVEITEVLAEISRQAKVTIIPQRDVNGRVSGVVAGESIERGLGNFLESNGFALEREGSVYRVKRQNSGQGTVISVNPDGTLDIDVTNANLAAVLTELAKKKNYGIVIYANVNWNVTSVHLSRVPFEEALARLLSGTTFTYRREGETYLVGEGVNFRQGDTDFIQSELIVLKYVSAEAVWNTIPPAFPRQNITLLKDNNALLVNGTPKVIDALKAYLAKVDVPPGGVRTEIIPLKHMKAEDALKLLPPSMPKNDLVVIKEVNGIAVTGGEGYRAQVRDYLGMVDVAAPMILFDVLVLQFTRNESSGWGIEAIDLRAGGDQILKWEMGSLIGTIISPGSAAALKLTASIRAAVSDGRAKVRANPKIATISGNKAHFAVVTKYNYTLVLPSSGGTGGTTTPQYQNFQVESGITIDMTPWVSAEKDINLDLKPSISQYASSPSVGGSVTALPGVMSRASESTVRIRDGYTVIISGFIQETEEYRVAKIPLLGSIPLLGNLFRSTTKEKRQDEFVIVITPRLIEDPGDLNKYAGEVTGPGSQPEPIAIDLDEEKKER